MPAQKSTSTLKGKYGPGLKKAVETHKKDETTFSGGASLPGGIEAGVAELDKCYFAQYKEGTKMAGEWYFMASGTVTHPREFNGVPIAGLRTQIGPEPLCDTPERTRKTTEDHVAWVMNELRKLGVNTADFDELEDMAAAAQEAAPAFHFRTWQGDKQTTGPYAGQEPRVNHDWRGFCNPAENGSDGVVDETPAADYEQSTAAEEAPEDDIPFEQMIASLITAARDDNSVDAQHRMAAIAEEYGVTEAVDSAEGWGEAGQIILDAYGASQNGAAESTEETVEEAAAEDTDGETDWTALGYAADNEGDQAAADALTEAGNALGLDENDYPSWANFAEDIAAQSSGEETAEEQPFTPEKNDVLFFKPPKTKTAVECEVTMVFPKSKTANLRNLETKAIYKNVAWEALSEG